jgi:hypothetical protein
VPLRSRRIPATRPHDSLPPNRSTRKKERERERWVEREMVERERERDGLRERWVEREREVRERFTQRERESQRESLNH